MKKLESARRPRPSSDLRTSGERRGAATVEFAVCLPVIVLLVFGAIEASSLIFLRQSLEVAAYEGIRSAVDVGGTEETGRQRATDVLDARRVQGFVIEFPNGDPDDTPRGDEVVLTVRAPAASNSALFGRYISTSTLRAQAVMVKQ